jgi:hypothetical protein
MRILLPGNLTKKKLPLKKLRVRRTRLMGFLVYELNCHTNCLFFTLKMHKKKSNTNTVQTVPIDFETNLKKTYRLL